MTYTILIPLAITAACFLHFHRKLQSNAGWYTRIVAGLVTLGLAITISVVPWGVWGVVMWRLA